MLCKDAILGDNAEDSSGHPMEAALLRAGRLAELRRSELLSHYPKARKHACDAGSKMMATYFAAGGLIRTIAEEGCRPTMIRGRPIVSVVSFPSKLRAGGIVAGAEALNVRCAFSTRSRKSSSPVVHLDKCASGREGERHPTRSRPQNFVFC